MKTLEVKKREVNKTEQTKKEGNIPAVYYGKKTESTPISVSMIEFKKMWKEVGESGVFNIKDGNKEMQALIHSVQLHSVSDEPIHVDFYIIEKGQTVEVSIPIEFFGESPAVKNLGGVLVKVLHEIEVEAEPKDLPHEIKVDISSLVDFESRITIKDLKFPAGVKSTEDSDEVVALVSEAKEEVEPVVEVDLSSIEVEKKGKEEKEGEEPTSTDKKPQTDVDKKK